MVNSEFEGCEFGGRHAPTFTRAKPKQKPGEYKVIITMAVTIILTWTFLNVDGIEIKGRGFSISVGNKKALHRAFFYLA